MAAWEGLNWRATPVDLPLRALWHFDLTASHVRRPGGGEGRGVHREWMWAGSNRYVEVEYRGAWDGQRPSGGDFWSRPQETQKEALWP